MHPYTLALFFHLLSLLLAVAAMALALYGALWLREASHAAEAFGWLRLVERVVPLFPVAVVGLLGTGAYMTHARWGWSLPWIEAALAGLGLIVLCGSGVEGSRMRALRRELAAGVLSPRAERLLRDPVAWSARLTTFTLTVAVVFVMTMKPEAVGSGAALALAVAAGPLAALPFWKFRLGDARAGGHPASPLAGGDGDEPGGLRVVGASPEVAVEPDLAKAGAP